MFCTNSYINHTDVLLSHKSGLKALIISQNFPLRFFSFIPTIRGRKTNVERKIGATPIMVM